MNYCDWTERVNANGSVTWKCSNKTEEKQDEYGRAYCTEHRIKVDQINKSRHKHCINRGKLLDLLRLEYENSRSGKKVWTYLINKIESGELDND